MIIFYICKRVTIPLSLYIHIPWCIKKCPYCDFNSHTFEQLPEQAYVAALLEDLSMDLALFSDYIAQRKIHSIFIGGGTPSLLSSQAFEQLLDGIVERIALEKHCEITLEANPGTAEAQKFKDFHTLGINRLSMGVQSFHDAQLSALGRIHNGAEAIHAFELARQAGFDNINLDIMFALPQQKTLAALKDLEMAIDLQPEHVSWYQLTIEPQTFFARHPPVLPNDSAIWEMTQEGENILEKNSYHRYEISAFCKSQKHSQHNLNYWQFGDYLGIGAGAHGKLTNMKNLQIIRTRKRKMPQAYLAQNPFLVENRQILLTEKPLEFMMNVLRLTEGVATTMFQQRCGLSMNTLDKTLQQTRRLGLLDNRRDRIQATPLGLRFLNDLLLYFGETE